MNLGLSDKVAVVLASTAGLGRAVAESLLAEGARVAISGRDPARLEHTLAQLEQKHPGRVLGARLDVRNEADLVGHLNIARTAFGPIDILVWNSGGPPPGAATSVDGEALDEAYTLLLRPAVRAIRHVLPSMRERGFGRILALTSVAVRQPIPSLALSNVLRSGLTAYLKSLSAQVAKDGVLVNSICTGMFDTERAAELMTERARTAGRTAKEERSLSEAQIPVGRFGRPAELGEFVAFLASERASYMNGAAVPLDGGLTRALL